MPTYNYRCNQCGSDFEQYHSVSETCAACFVCGSENFIKIPSIGNIIKKIEIVRKKDSEEAVRNHIEKSHEDLKKYQEELKNRIIE